MFIKPDSVLKDRSSTRSSERAEKSHRGDAIAPVNVPERGGRHPEFVVDWQMKATVKRANINPEYFH
ncbi:hypothetical protein [Mangrovibacterium marinum]|uniref:Uncharacterized protein n=1 Tax=Mangrovibacterium marinum TaxID=1639118 RepID=A0A2T5C264_9BACT|nr:hypothetical protein [Mangrovibacterium marinum]PTN08778.1 hypothetical protein C8N47_107138 [Mangrovibacterium marinum]